jgi:hypothetical protein
MPSEKVTLAVVDRVGTSISSISKYGCLLGCAYFAFRIIDSLAGKTTLASIVANVVADLNLGCKISWGVTIVSVVWAVRERRLRIRRIAEMAEEKQQVETRLDPKRTSSTLPKTGKTKKEDRE